MIPRRVPDFDTLDRDSVCALAESMVLDPRVLLAVSQGQRELPYPLQIISAHRTAEEQEALRREGRPTAPDNLSTHRSCPATGVDVWPIGVEVVPAVKAAIGAALSRAGLRWGGGSAPDGAGIPSDWNHFDLGPRR